MAWFGLARATRLTGSAGLAGGAGLTRDVGCAGASGERSCLG
ncbi:hypothetical protein ACIA5C_13140 [Actinoplanes sp. NPDC051343]